MPNRRFHAGGFTLIEIMIVVAIMGIVLTMGVPSFVHALRKEGIRKATSDMVEACGNARATAILSGLVTDVVIRPKDGTISVAKENVLSSSLRNAGNFGASTTTAATAPPAAFTAQIPGNVAIELLGVNFIEYQEAAEARVRFYPNGMSDEFTIILRSDQQEWRKITLEPVTALAEVSIVR